MTSLTEKVLPEVLRLAGMLLAVALVALCSSGCAPQTLDRHSEVRISAADAERFPEAVEAAVHGFEVWAEDTSGVIAPRLVIGGDSPHVLKFRDTDWFGCEGFSRTGCAENTTDGVVIEIATRWSVRTMAAVVTHELGHGFGLDHTREGGLMCAGFYEDDPLYIDNVTARAAYAHFDLNIATDGMRPAWPCPSEE